jgi:hypothetical protein
MTLQRTLLRLTAGAALMLGAACNDNESPPADDHTPVTYSVLINGTAATAPYTFTEGQTARVQLKFFNAASEDLDDVESDHFAALSFSPAVLAVVEPVTDHHFQFDVTGNAAGTGTIQIGFGHDALADEHSFTADAIMLQAPSGPRQ